MGLEIIIEKEQTLSHNYEAKETITKKNIMYEGYGYELGEILSDAFEIEINVGKNLFLNEETVETLQREIDSLFKEPQINQFLIHDLITIKNIISLAIEDNNQDDWTWYLWG